MYSFLKANLHVKGTEREGREVGSSGMWCFLEDPVWILCSGQGFFFLTENRKFGFLKKICTNETLLGFSSACDRPIVAFCPGAHHPSAVSTLFVHELTLTIVRQRHKTVIFPPEHRNLPILPEGHLTDFRKTWS